MNGGCLVVVGNHLIDRRIFYFIDLTVIIARRFIYLLYYAQSFLRNLKYIRFQTNARARANKKVLAKLAINYR
jgi:hypothetical protein